MSGAGTDVALETADLALMAYDLSRLPFAIALSRAAHTIVQQNLWAGIGVVTLLIPTTLFGLASMGIAVLVHEGATVLVVPNALRLLRFVETADPQVAHVGLCVRQARAQGIPVKTCTAGVIHAYPTQGEAVRMAAQACAVSLASAAQSIKKVAARS